MIRYSSFIISLMDMPRHRTLRKTARPITGKSGQVGGERMCLHLKQREHMVAG